MTLQTTPGTFVFWIIFFPSKKIIFWWVKKGLKFWGPIRFGRPTKFIDTEKILKKMLAVNRISTVPKSHPYLYRYPDVRLIGFFEFPKTSRGFFCLRVCACFGRPKYFFAESFQKKTTEQILIFQVCNSCSKSSGFTLCNKTKKERKGYAQTIPNSNLLFLLKMKTFFLKRDSNWLLENKNSKMNVKNLKIWTNSKFALSKQMSEFHFTRTHISPWRHDAVPWVVVSLFCWDKSYKYNRNRKPWFVDFVVSQKCFPAGWVQPVFVQNSNVFVENRWKQFTMKLLKLIMNSRFFMFMAQKYDFFQNSLSPKPDSLVFSPKQVVWRREKMFFLVIFWANIFWTQW